MSAPNRGATAWVGSSLGAETPSLEAAIQDAYDQARRGHEGELHLKVVATYVIGTNPITEYRVKLRPA